MILRKNVTPGRNRILDILCLTIAFMALLGAGFAGKKAGEVVPATGRFALAAEPSTLFAAQRLQQERHVLQSFAFDEAGESIYVLQVEGANAVGTFAEHSARGDLVLTRLSLDGQTITGHMVLRGFGHGVAMGVERSGGDVYVWTEVDAEVTPRGSGRGKKLGRFRFAEGMTLDTSSARIEKFAPIPGARVCTPSIDATTRRIAVRYVAADGGWRVALFNLAQLQTGKTQPLADIRLPFAFGTVQGWCTFGSYLYVYSGEAYSDRNRPPGNATLWCIDWNTGALVEQQRTTAFVDSLDREPEGIAVQTTTATPRLCFGFGIALAAGDPRRRVSIAYNDDWRAEANEAGGARELR